MNDIERKKIENEKINKIARDLLKPECDEELSEDEYPIINEEE
jgi:hypothetical protein